MKKLYILSPVIFLMVGVLFAQQSGQSIHQVQHSEFRHQSFQVEVPSLEKGYTPLDAPNTSLNSEVFGFHPYWAGTAWQNYNFNLVTTVAYFGIDVRSNGTFGNTHNWPVTSLINTAHQHGVKVVVVAILFDADGIATLLENADYRQALIDNLVSSVQSAGADGVNIDFENMPSGQESNFVAFMQDLTQAFHTQIPGSQVTIDMPAVNWGDRFDVNGLANACDGLMIMGYNYHWNGSSNTGPVAPLTGGSINVTNTVNYYLNETGDDNTKLILGLPYYGIQWPTSSSSAGAPTTGSGSSKFYSEAEALAVTYGKLRYSEGGSIPWYRYEVTGGWRQGWYDDSLSLSLKYQLALQEDLKGVGIWALSYDGNRQELWGALSDHFVLDTIPPLTPENFYVKNHLEGSVKVGFAASTRAQQYRIYSSLDGTNFSLLDETFDTVNLYGDLPQDSVVYLRVTATNNAGESNPTEVLAVVPGTQARILIVNGFDRLSGTTNTRDFVRRHGPAIWAHGHHFVSASNEAVLSGDVYLRSYGMVDWVLGEEGTSTSAFTPEEQAKIIAYLDGGGKFFVSGSEIGYDLVGNGSVDDQYFYENYLKAEYITDGAGGPYSFYPDGDPAFSGLGTIQFDDGTHGTYDVDWPDGIHPAGGSEIALKYTDTDYTSLGGAAVVFTGSFSLGAPEAKLVYLSPGFEAIYPESSRNQVMGKTFDYFGTITNAEPDQRADGLPDQFHLARGYPNPFNGSVNIRFQVPNSKRKTTIEIYDLLGQRVRRLLSRTLSPGEGEVQWYGTNQNGKTVSSGTYLVVARHGKQVETTKITYLK